METPRRSRHLYLGIRLRRERNLAPGRPGQVLTPVADRSTPPFHTPFCEEPPGAAYFQARDLIQMPLPAMTTSSLPTATSLNDVTTHRQSTFEFLEKSPSSIVCPR